MACKSAVTPSLRVCVVSDIRMYRDALAAALENASGFDVTAVGSADLAAVRWSGGSSPAVIIVDIATCDAFPLIRVIREEHPAVRIVAFGVEDSEREILACAEEGVASYVCREACSEDLVDAVIGAANGELNCSRHIAGALFQRVASLAGRVPSLPETLTTRELEVLHLIRDGLPNKQIADQLSISETTVKSHVHKVFAKLRVTSRAQAARFDMTGRQRSR